MTIAARLARLERSRKVQRPRSLQEMTDDELLFIIADGDVDLLAALADETSGALERLALSEAVGR